MKLNQLENIDNLDEAPQGFLKRTALRARSAFGGDGGASAKGQLQTGEIANILKKEYMQFVGRTAAEYGNKPTTQTLLAFLNKKGIDTREIAGMIDKELQALAPQKQNQPQAEPEKVEPEVGSDSELDKLKPQSSTDDNNPLAMNKKDDVDINVPVTMKRQKTGGRQKGGLVNTPSAIYQRNRRKKAGDQLELLSMYSEESQRYRKNFERIDWTLKEDAEYFGALKFMGVFEAVIPNNVLDKVLSRISVNIDKDDLGGLKPSSEPIAQKQDEPDSDDNTAQTGTDGSQEKKSGGFLKGIGKAIGGIAGKAKDGVQSGMGDNPEDAKASKIFDPDEEEEKTVGSLNYQNIAKEFPGIDATALRRSMSKSLQGKQLTRAEHETMSAAMTQLLKKDPQQTVKVMNLFKQTKAA